MKRFTLDAEWDASASPPKIWVVVLRNIDNFDEFYVYERPDTNEEVRRNFLEFLHTIDVLSGHYFLRSDIPVLNSSIVSWSISDKTRLVDTLVWSHLLNYRIEGGHSIEAWGERLGTKKEGVDITDWTLYTEDMRKRCISDTLIGAKLFLYLEKWLGQPEWRAASDIEHYLGVLCDELERTGFPFDIRKARELYNSIESRLQPIRDEIVNQGGFKANFLREITPRETKSGLISKAPFRFLGDNPDLTPYSADAPFSLIEWKEFNPASVRDRVELLNKAGWKPTEKTEGYKDAESELKLSRDKKRRQELKDKIENHYKIWGWKTSEENLKTLPDTAPPAAKKLVEFLLLSSRLSDLDEWISLYNPSTGAIHGHFNSIGAWTQRMSHSKPNMANIPVPQGGAKTELDKYAYEIATNMRSLFHAPRGYAQIGTDADGIQMRIFAHLVNDQRLIEALIRGKKEDGTDIHSIHKTALGNVCKSRDNAKTFIYAFLLGAASARVSAIFGCSIMEARKAIEQFLEFYPSLRDIKENQIPRDAARGYFVGLDGRLVVCDSEHLMLGGYLQNGEKIIMSRACRSWRTQLQKEKIPFRQVNFVHDEWQTLVPDDPEIIEFVKKIQIKSIEDQGIELNLNCPLAGNAKVGRNWMETH